MLQALRRIGALAAPYFMRSDQRWTARGLIATVVALNLGSVYMTVLSNGWYRRFYDALQEKDQATFWREIVYFIWIATAFIVIAILKYYLTQLLQLRWRAWMTRDYLSRWMANNTFYRLELARYAGHHGGTPDRPHRMPMKLTRVTTAFSRPIDSVIV